MNDIIFWLPWPPTINSYWAPIKGSIYLSKKGRIYRDKAVEAIAEQIPGIHIDDRVMVEITMHPPDNRVRDLDNYTKAIMDAITHSELWTDDNLADQVFLYRGETVSGGTVKIEINEAGPTIPYELKK